MLFQVPRKHTHLIEVIRQPRLIRTQYRHVDRNILIFLFGLGVVHRRQNIRPHNPLPLRVPCDRIRSVHIHHPAVEPPRIALGISHQPPVLHHRRRRLWRRCSSSRNSLSTLRRATSRSRGNRRGSRSSLRHSRSRRHWFSQRGPRQQLQLLALSQPKEPLRISPRFGVHVNLISHNRRGDHRISLVILLQLFKLVEDVLGRNHLLVNPTLFPFGRLHLHESPAVIKHLKPIAILHRRRAIRHRCHSVTQEGLLCRHIHVLRWRLRPQSRAATPARNKHHRKRCEAANTRKVPHETELSRRRNDSPETPRHSTTLSPY